MKFKEYFSNLTGMGFFMFKRMFARTMVLATLTILGLTVVDWLVDLGLADRYAIVRRFPEFIPMMMAAAKFTFIEMSLFWIRFGTQHRIDVQRGIQDAMTSSYMAAAFIHFTNSLVWFARVAIFIYLMG
jgi:hypothetical protein